eukprot:753585-Hanusia_phi.AAC.4
MPSVQQASRWRRCEVILFIAETPIKVEIIYPLRALAHDQHIDRLKGPSAVHHPPENPDRVAVAAAVEVVGLGIDDVLLVDGPGGVVVVVPQSVALEPLPPGRLLVLVRLLVDGLKPVEGVSPLTVLGEVNMLEVKVPLDVVPRVAVEVAVHDGRHAADQDGGDVVPMVHRRPGQRVGYPLELELRDQLIHVLLLLLVRHLPQRGDDWRVCLAVRLVRHAVPGVEGLCHAQHELVLVHAVLVLVYVNPFKEVPVADVPQSVLGYPTGDDVLGCGIHPGARDLSHTGKHIRYHDIHRLPGPCAVDDLAKDAVQIALRILVDRVVHVPPGHQRLDQEDILLPPVVLLVGGIHVPPCHALQLGLPLLHGAGVRNPPPAVCSDRRVWIEVVGIVLPVALVVEHDVLEVEVPMDQVTCEGREVAIGDRHHPADERGRKGVTAEVGGPASAHADPLEP